MKTEGILPPYRNQQEKKNQNVSWTKGASLELEYSRPIGPTKRVKDPAVTRQATSWWYAL